MFTESQGFQMDYSDESFVERPQHHEYNVFQMDHQKGLQTGASSSLLVTLASSAAAVDEAPLHVATGPWLPSEHWEVVEHCLTWKMGHITLMTAQR